MKRTRIDIEAIADFRTMAVAAGVAAKGKKSRNTVQAFFGSFETNVSRLSADLLSGVAPYGRYAKFTVFDPKKRTIHAAIFEDRVIHQAMMLHMGPVLDRALIPTTFACRAGKGNTAAIQAVQRGLRRYPWYVRIDVLRFFDSIAHDHLMSLVRRKLKGSCLDLLQKVVASYSNSEERGLPIGSLTSQHLANYYLNALDRYMIEEQGVRNYVRYMDDVVWWTHAKEEARRSLHDARKYLGEHLDLQCNERVVQVNMSQRGLTYCGFLVHPGCIRLTSRKKRRYAELRKEYEDQYIRGEMTGLELQQAYASLAAILEQADSLSWRQGNHQRRGVVDA